MAAGEGIWFYHYSKYDDTELRAGVPSQELSDALMEQAEQLKIKTDD